MRHNDTTLSKHPSCLALLQNASNPVSVHEAHCLSSTSVNTLFVNPPPPRRVFRTLLIAGRRDRVGGSLVILPAAPYADKISFVLLVEGSVPGVCWNAGSSRCSVCLVDGIFVKSFSIFFSMSRSQQNNSLLLTCSSEWSQHCLEEESGMSV